VLTRLDEDELDNEEEGGQQEGDGKISSSFNCCSMLTEGRRVETERGKRRN
jgi:hypothetical protein